MASLTLIYFVFLPVRLYVQVTKSNACTETVKTVVPKLCQLEIVLVLTQQRKCHGLNGELSRKSGLSKMEKRKCCPSQSNEKNKGIWETCGTCFMSSCQCSPVTSSTRLPSTVTSGISETICNPTSVLCTLIFLKTMLGRCTEKYRLSILVRLRSKSPYTQDVITLQGEESCFVVYPILCSMTLPLCGPFFILFLMKLKVHTHLLKQFTFSVMDPLLSTGKKLTFFWCLLKFFGGDLKGQPGIILKPAMERGSLMGWVVPWSEQLIEEL